MADKERDNTEKEGFDIIPQFGEEDSSKIILNKEFLIGPTHDQVMASLAEDSTKPTTVTQTKTKKKVEPFPGNRIEDLISFLENGKEEKVVKKFLAALAQDPDFRKALQRESNNDYFGLGKKENLLPIDKIFKYQKPQKDFIPSFTKSPNPDLAQPAKPDMDVEAKFHDLMTTLVGNGKIKTWLATLLQNPDLAEELKRSIATSKDRDLNPPKDGKTRDYFNPPNDEIPKMPPIKNTILPDLKNIKPNRLDLYENLNNNPWKQARKMTLGATTVEWGEDEEGKFIKVGDKITRL